MRHVITLSTIPPRFAGIGPALRSLVAQRSRPEAVELYIPRSYRRFPDWGGGLPEVPEGVRIVRVDEDLGPATKILPAARAWRGTGVELIYLDDDRIYDPTMAQTCLALRKRHPGTALCGAGFSLAERYGYAVSDGPQPRAVKAADPRQQAGFQLRKLWLTLNARGKVTRAPYWRRFDRSGYVDIAEGLGGVMVQPEFFDDAAFAIPPILWTVDDIWLSGTLARRGIPIWVDCRLRKIRTMIDVSLTDPLYKLVVEGVGRLEADRACIEHMRRTYGIWGGVAAQST